jgi:GNAT superfamily N-acetyltransferase
MTDLVITGGAVWGTEHTALAVAGGRVVALGERALAESAGATAVVELDGGAVLPSFGDGHCHPIQAGVAASLAPVAELPSVADVVSAVAKWAREHPGAEWVRGDGYDPALAPAGVFDAGWLDAVVPDRPVWLRASDYHTAWVNTRALELAGIHADTPQPDDGEIVRRPDGSVAGTLREWGAWRRIAEAAPPIPVAAQADALLEVCRTYARLGVTWVQDAWVEPHDVSVWLTAADSGRLAVEANLALLADPGTWRDDVQMLLDEREEVARHDQLTARTVKFFADGIIEAGTAALLEPYLDCPHSTGLPNWDWAELAEAVTALDAHGFQVHIHAIGDAAVRAARPPTGDRARPTGAPGRSAPIRPAGGDRQPRAAVGAAGHHGHRTHEPAAWRGSRGAAVSDRHPAAGRPGLLRFRLAGQLGRPAPRDRGRAHPPDARRHAATRVAARRADQPRGGGRRLHLGRGLSGVQGRRMGPDPGRCTGGPGRPGDGPAHRRRPSASRGRRARHLARGVSHGLMKPISDHAVRLWASNDCRREHVVMDGLSLTVLGPRDVNLLLNASHLFDVPVRPQWAQRFLSSDGHHLVLAQDATGTPIGFVSGVEMTHPDKGTEMFLYELGVAESVRRQGVGTRLVTALREIATANGCHSMWVALEGNNDAARRTYAADGATLHEGQVVATWDLLDGGA